LLVVEPELLVCATFIWGEVCTRESVTRGLMRPGNLVEVVLGGAITSRVVTEPGTMYSRVSLFFVDSRDLFAQGNTRAKKPGFSGSETLVAAGGIDPQAAGAPTGVGYVWTMLAEFVISGPGLAAGRY
jgi:hypothetical protein